MSTPTIDDASARFEKLWSKAMSGTSTQQSIDNGHSSVPDYFLPKSVLQGLQELSNHCLKRKLINGEQHTQLCQCFEQQQAVFATIDPEVLRALIVEVDDD